MDWLLLAIGFIFGCTITRLITNRHKPRFIGTIIGAIDPDNQQLYLHLDLNCKSYELYSTKEAIVKLNMPQK